MPNGLSSFLGGQSGKFEQVPRFASDQQQAMQTILQQALQGLQPDQFGQGFAPIAQQARQQFHEQTVPSIMERFTGMNGQDSGAFEQALGQAGAGLESNLASQQAQFGLQQQGLLQQLLGMGLQPQFESIYRPRTPGILELLGAPLAQGAGSFLPIAAQGGGLGNIFSGLGR